MGLLTYITRNLAYRITYVGNAELSTLSGALDAVTITEDAKGRVTARDYTPSDPTFAGLFDSYFLYDRQDRVTCETTTYQSSCPSSGSGLKNQLKDFTAAGDWGKLLRAVPGSTGFMNQFTLGTGTHQITAISQNDGSPILGDTVMAYDERGNRKYDDNTSTLSHDRRDYTYDARKNVVNVRGEYKTGGAWHFYDVASAFDARDRRVYKSFFDESTLKTATWFFYYDPFDRLSEVWYTPDTGAPSTYSVFQLFWLEGRPVAYWQTDFPSGTETRRYVSTDEAGRPIKLWTWPSSGSTTNVWATNPDGWGRDLTLVGPGVYQPLSLPLQYRDVETAAFLDDGATVHRASLAVGLQSSYDPSTGVTLQLPHSTEVMGTSYLFAASNPVVVSEPRRAYDAAELDAAIDGLPHASSGAPGVIFSPNTGSAQLYWVQFFYHKTVCHPPDSAVDHFGVLETTAPPTFGAPKAGALAKVATVGSVPALGGMCTTFAHLGYAIVECDRPCVGTGTVDDVDDICHVVRSGGAEYDNYYFARGEFGTVKPGVHLADAEAYGMGCTCGCSDVVCCDLTDLGDVDVDDTDGNDDPTNGFPAFQ